MKDSKALCDSSKVGLGELYFDAMPAGDGSGGHQQISMPVLC
jgi:hypothetical protein